MAVFRDDPNARGKAGEIGLGQVKPETARMLGYTGTDEELFVPVTNITYICRYLVYLSEIYQKIDYVIGAYNLGKAEVNPDGTLKNQNYVLNVLLVMNYFKSK